MININCCLPCFYENDGKCTLTHITSLSSTPHPQCVYFVPKEQNIKAKKNITEH
ncbi:hydroxymyristoyl-ACP dehydratase [Crassaminicella thermophila]|uniref:Hydroxymyristoyl-ACP dehydratase n=1 Tax=Crassaminicella thermophila TaxID=2599308 RepID=A0A5C0SHR0_CRATE|nr:hydroxymyristoyl-ACP dehydratase [Crassaminicella thermophila]